MDAAVSGGKLPREAVKLGHRPLPWCAKNDWQVESNQGSRARLFLADGIVFPVVIHTGVSDGQLRYSAQY